MALPSVARGHQVSEACCLKPDAYSFAHSIVFCASRCNAWTESSRSSLGVSSSLVWLRPLRLLTKSITVGMRRAISAASCRGPLGSRCDLPATSLHASSAREIKSSSKGIGSIRHRRSHSTETSSSLAMRAVACCAASGMLASSAGSVEAHLAPPVESCDDCGADVDEPRGGPHVVGGRGVVPEGYGRAGRRYDGVPPHFHRRGA